jgi:hypothetical protein
LTLAKSRRDTLLISDCGLIDEEKEWWSSKVLEDRGK